MVTVRLEGVPLCIDFLPRLCEGRVRTDHPVHAPKAGISKVLINVSSSAIRTHFRLHVSEFAVHGRKRPKNACCEDAPVLRSDSDLVVRRDMPHKSTVLVVNTVLRVGKDVLCGLLSCFRVQRRNGRGIRHSYIVFVSVRFRTVKR